MPASHHPLRRALLALAAGTAGGWLLRRDAGTPRLATPTHLAEAERAQAASNAALCSSANVAGVGLRGEYFGEEGCRGTPLLVRQDASVDFDASLDWPAAQHIQPRSVRWSGWVKPVISGPYRFHADVPAARIVVARQPLAGRDAPQPASIELDAGRYYPIALTLERLMPGTQRIRLEWTAPHGARFLVPPALLYLPTEAARA